MTRYKAILAYDGTNFAGFQRQTKLRTVQGELEKALTKMNKKVPVTIAAAGRTDAGVHALGQVFHFDFPYDMPGENMQRALNSVLPKDLSIVEVAVVSSDFHARFCATGKTYQYRVDTAKLRDPFKHNYASFYPYEVSLERMLAAAELLRGTHDFTSFCSSKTEVENRVRTVDKIDIRRDVEHNELIFTLHGNGFLYNMVRAIVGVLLEIGQGRKAVTDIPVMLAAKDRSATRVTAPAQGLYLVSVDYEK